MFYRCLTCNTRFIFKPTKCNCGNLKIHEVTKKEFDEYMKVD